MGRHRQAPTKKNKKWGPVVSTGIALEAATLFAFASVTDGHPALDPSLAAATSIFVDGTKSITGNEKGLSPYRMADSFNGTYDQTPTVVDTDSSGPNKFVIYPRSLGPLTGLGDPTYDASEGVATSQTVQAVRDATDPTKNPGYQSGDPIYVVGYSQGAGGVVKAIPELEAEFPDANLQYVLAANPRRNDGGILTRFPPGVYVPVVGVTFGGGTTAQNSHVLQITKQYDGVGDAPKYFVNVVADLNAAMGFYYLHPGYYETVDPSAEPADDRIVSTTADGNVTDVLIKAPVGELPLTMPLLQLGVPKSLVVALDPMLRAIIETGYDRPVGPGTYPSTPVPFQLLPPPTSWARDAQSVADGVVQTAQNLTGVAGPSTLVAADDARTVRTATVSQIPAPDPKTKQTAKATAKTQPGPTPTPTPTPMKFDPPHVSSGGWHPGDLLRQLFAPKPVSGDDSSHASTSPSTPPAPSKGSADASDPSASPTT